MARDIFLSPCNTVAFFLRMKTMSSSLSTFFINNDWREIGFEEIPINATRAMLLRDPRFRLISAQNQAIKNISFLTEEQIKQLNSNGKFLTDIHSNTTVDEQIVNSIIDNNIVIIPYLELDENLPYNFSYTLTLLDLFFKEYKLDLNTNQIPLENKSTNYLNTDVIVTPIIYNLDYMVFDTVMSKIDLYKLTPEYIALETERRKARGTRRTYLQDLSFYDVYPRQIMDDYSRLFKFFTSNSKY